MRAVDTPSSSGAADRSAVPASGDTFGTRLTRLRVEAGLSQAELAGDDLSASYVSLLEADKRRPSSDVLALLADRLGCSTTMLLEGQQSERERRVDLELAYSRLALTHGEKQSARDRLEALLHEDALGRRATDEAQLLLASAYENLGDLQQAVTVLEPLFERVVRRESHLIVTAVGVTLTGCYIDAGDFRHAAEVGERAFRAAVEHGLAGTDDYFRLASTLMFAYHEAGDVMRAATWGQSLIDEAEAQGSETGQAAIYWNAAVVAETQGRIDEALVLSQRALAKMGEHGDSRDLGRLRLAMAQLMLLAQPPRAEQALQMLESTREALLDLGSLGERAIWSTTVAGALLLIGDPEGAVEQCDRALRSLDILETRDAAAALLTSGDVQASQARMDDALDAYHRAGSILSRGERNRTLSRLWRDLGDRFLDAGQTDASVQAYRQALDGVGVTDRTSELRAQLRRLAAGEHRQVRQPDPNAVTAE